MYRLGQATILEIRGRDRSKVLNNVATQDLRSLDRGQSLETFITETKGRSLGHGMAVGLTDRHLFVTVPGQAERLFAHLDRFIIMEDAVVKDISHSCGVWLICNSADFPESLGVAPGRHQSIEILFDGETVIAFWSPWISDTSVLLLVPLTVESRLATSTSIRLIDSDLNTRSSWEFMRINNFWPWYGLDCDEKNLPQEIDRNDQAISFNKGCYLGQETIARLDALGQVQKKLVRLRIHSEALPDIADPAQLLLYSGEAEIGHLKSVAKEDANSVIGLAMVKRSHFASGTEIMVGAARVPAQVL